MEFQHEMFDLSRPEERFQHMKVPMRRPQEIACFSYDENHEFLLGDASMSYYYPPKLPADLNPGFDTFRELIKTADEHLDALLDTITALEKEKGKKCEADIITWRGMMTKANHDCSLHPAGWLRNECDLFPVRAQCMILLSLLRFKPDLLTYYSFIEENNSFKNEEKERQFAEPPRPGAPSQELMCYWGYKFETLSVLKKPWDASTRQEIENRPNEIVNNHAQYCSVVATRFGDLRAILGGEVDAIWDCKPERKNDQIHWVELKTTEEPARNKYGMLKMERKLLKYWAQSFLLGVPTIIVGFRDKYGIVQRIEEMDTAQIPVRVQRGLNSWNAQVCINFAASFLEWLKQVIGGRDGTWRIRKGSHDPQISVYRLETGGHGDILPISFEQWRTQT
ncbi:hypothetical protein N7532_006160 [Penicillium argentinense]|uniref:Decapping nuclease n=1 Tax=Penicillium argentinense TaxID=1131581 RepID=A0A9W9FFE5_9EURO|nr:uncharacterized protein N7532_006160 [Penicillium argentinense]KAJ5099159.1 hypothetical protein N7532_006160 [Penicillium argentinense]